LHFFFWPLCCLHFFFWPLCCLHFFFWPLCCLHFFDLRFLVTPLVSLNFSYSTIYKLYVQTTWYKQWTLSASLR
jgi:hypothetical protein